MAKKTGRVATLELDDGGGYVSVGNVIDMSFSGSVENHDATDRDDSGYDAFLYGHWNGQISGSWHYNEADAGQEDIRDMWTGKTTATFRFRVHGTDSGAREILATGYVQALSSDTPLRDTAKQSFTIQLSGTPTFQTQ